MAGADLFEVYDGFASLIGGMNGGVLSTQIGETQYARGVNVACRDGTISTRPPFIEVLLESDIEGAVTNITTGKFQGMTYFQVGANAYIIFAFNGYVYVLNPVTETIYDMTAIIGGMSQTVDRLHYCQVEEYVIVQDGTNIPMIISEAGGVPASRKAVPGDNEVPIGTVMAYVHGRLFIKTENRSFIAGDINQPDAPGAVLVFIEDIYLAGGGAFSLPADKGDIISMTWAQSYADATGEGSLLVLCERGIASYQVSVPRLQWQDMAIAKIEPGGNGCASEFCSVRMNEDLLFMGWNGIQDFALLSVESAKYHRMTNLDTEVKPFIKQETQALLPFTHAARFDDRYLYTAIGETVTAKKLDATDIDDYRFKGLIALDFAPMDGISSMGQNMAPAYDGIWTGVHPIGLASGIFAHEERCYVFGKDDDGINHLYELMKDPGHDKGNIPIQCRLYSRGMPFIAYDKDYPRPVPHYMKTLNDGSLWITSYRDAISFTLAVSPNNSLFYHEISTISLDAPMVEDVAPFAAGNYQSRAKAPFPAFNKTQCDRVTQKSALTGYEMEFLITWAGVADISKFMIAAEGTREIRKMGCDYIPVVLTGSLENDFTYDIENP